MFNPHSQGGQLGHRLAEAWFSPSWTTELPLRLLAAFAGALPADGAALLFAGDTSRLSLQAVCASPGLAMRVEDLQLVIGECPATRAFHDGRPVLVPELGRRDDRWTAFSAGVGTDRHSAMFAFPLDVGKLRIGVLDLYRKRSGPISDVDLAAAARAGTALALGLLDASTAIISKATVKPWSDQRGPVILLSQATGMIAEQLQIPSEEASVRLRAHAFASGMPLADVVRDVLERRLRLER